MNLPALQRLKKLRRRLERRFAPSFDVAAAEGAPNPALLSRIVASPSYGMAYMNFRRAPSVGVSFSRPVAPEFSTMLRIARIRVMEPAKLRDATLDVKVEIDPPYGASDEEVMDLLEKAFCFATG